MARAPLSPKFHGAWLGAGTGQEFANVITGVIQDYWTHAPLTASLQQLIYIVVTAALAGFGAYILPPGPNAVMVPKPVPAALPPAPPPPDPAAP